MTRALHETPIMTFSDNKTLYFAAYMPDKPTEEVARTRDSVSFDDNLSSCMFGIHIPTDDVPPEILGASNEEKWQTCAKAMKDWDPA